MFAATWRFRLSGDLIGHLATPSWIRVRLLQADGYSSARRNPWARRQATRRDRSRDVGWLQEPKTFVQPACQPYYPPAQLANCRTRAGAYAVSCRI